MISISSSTQFKNVCKYCNLPPSKFRKIGRFYKDNRDILQSIQDDSKCHGFSVISPSYIVEDALNQRLYSNYKFQLSYLSSQIRDYKALTVSVRKAKVGSVDKISIDEKYPRIAATCKCGKSIWIYNKNIKEFFPEFSRKSNLKK